MIYTFDMVVTMAVMAVICIIYGAAMFAVELYELQGLDNKNLTKWSCCFHAFLGGAIKGAIIDTSYVVILLIAKMAIIL